MVGPQARLNNAAPSLRPHYRAFVTTTGCSVPARRVGTLALAVAAACGFSLRTDHQRGQRDGAQVLTFPTRAWSRLAPPTRRMPLGPSQGIARADPAGRVTPRFWHRLIRFRRFCSGSLALAFLDLAGRTSVRTLTATLTTTALDRSSLQWLELSSWSPSPKGPPSSLVELRIPVWTRDARDTRPQADIANPMFTERYRVRLACTSHSRADAGVVWRL